MLLAAVILVGFALLTLGVALLILGEVPFVSGKRIPAVRSRLIGLICVSFLPMALALRQASIMLFEADAMQGPVVVGIWFVICLWAVFALLFRVLVPKQPRREPKAASKSNPFGTIEESTEPSSESAQAMPWTEPEPTKKPTPSKKGKPQAEHDNPFDFS